MNMTKETALNEFKHILAPGKIGNLTLKNRLIVTAMVTNYCNGDALPSERLIRYMEEKARGGWGLIITEDYAISPQAKASKNLMGLWSNDQIEPNARFVNRVHQAGGKICAQIFHAGRQSSYAAIGEQPVAPSAVREPTCNDVPRELTIDEIQGIISDFAEAAVRAQKAGFDMVEIHGAHGYLLDQFMSPFANKRGDCYGGSVENRMRFPLEVTRAVRKAVGKDYPISYRLNVSDEVKGGVFPNGAAILARLLEKEGVDLLNCSQGMYVTREAIIPPTAKEPGCFQDNAKVIRDAVSIPVSAVGRINDPYLADSIIESGKSDFISMGRASLADPWFPNKIMDGRVDEIIKCIACCQGCIGQSMKGMAIGCTVNPKTGYEGAYKELSEENRKKIAIIGAGISGCEAAIAAAERGHEVSLYEQSDKIGGQWNIASVPNDKDDFSSFVYWQKIELDKLKVKTNLEYKGTLQDIIATHPDELVIATGSLSLRPPISGLAKSPVVLDARDVLAGDVAVFGKVIVMGGGMVGCEVADFLATQKCKVTIVEMKDDIAQDAEPSPRKYLMRSLEENGVEVFTNTKVVAVDGNTMTAMRDDEEIIFAGADAIVLALGARSFNPFESELESYRGSVHVIGDAQSVKNGLENIREAYEFGMQI